MKNVTGLERPVPYEVNLQAELWFVIGIAGAMLVTLDGQFTPGTYQPLRFTFLIWIMVIIGGSGNNWGSVLGGFLVWFVWIEAEPAGLWLMDTITAADIDFPNTSFVGITRTDPVASSVTSTVSTCPPAASPA